MCSTMAPASCPSMPTTCSTSITGRQVPATARRAPGSACSSAATSSARWAGPSGRGRDRKAAPNSASSCRSTSPMTRSSPPTSPSRALRGLPPSADHRGAGSGVIQLQHGDGCAYPGRSRAQTRLVVERRATEPGGGLAMSVVEHTIEVNVPVRVAYDQWTQFEEFPQFMEGVKRVVQKDDTTLEWTAEIAGKEKIWTAEIVEQTPDQRVAWRSTSGAPNSGVVAFQSAGPDATAVTL